ncbi:MAG: oxygenase MpaB family protein [Acidimicrobiales bacterium]
MSLLTPVQRATALGGTVASAPLRLVDDLTAPARAGLTRDVRRSIGITVAPAPPSMDPEEAFLAPGSVARAVHADLPTMLIGGLGALLVQMLHPLAMAGGAEHSSYQSDPLGRLRRTADFVGTTTFGTVTEAEKAIEQVQRVHRRVRGVSPDGRAYSADDPELVTFIHVAEVSSFLASARRYGPRPLTPDECDQYYVDVAPVAMALGAAWVPRSAAEVESYFGRIRPELYAGPQARQARDWLRRGVAKRPEERAVYAVLLAAAIGTLPTWARRELGLAPPAPLDVLVDTVAVVPLSRMVSAGLRWVTAGGQRAMDRPPSTPTT